MADGDTKDGAGGDGALGRRGFLQLTAAGVVVAGTGLPADAAPGVRDGTLVVAAVYRVVGRFHRYLGAARGRTQGGAARLAFRCAPIGPVDAEGLTPLVFRARVGAAAGRLFPPRALDVLCTRPRFSA